MQVADIGYLIQAPSQSLKLKELKALIDEHSEMVFSKFSSKREALTFLKKKVRFVLLSEGCVSLCCYYLDKSSKHNLSPVHYTIVSTLNLYSIVILWCAAWLRGKFFLGH